MKKALSIVLSFLILTNSLQGFVYGIDLSGSGNVSTGTTLSSGNNLELDQSTGIKLSGGVSLSGTQSTEIQPSIEPNGIIPDLGKGKLSTKESTEKYDFLNSLSEDTVNIGTISTGISIQSLYKCEEFVGVRCSINLAKADTDYKYFVSVEGIISISTNSTTVYLKTLKVGTTTLSIRKNNKEVHTVSIRVKAKDLNVSTNSINIDNGTSTSFSITNGNGGYSVTSSNTSIATVQGSNTSWTVTGKSPGTTTIGVKDSEGKSLVILVTIKSTLKSLIIDGFNQSRVISLGDILSFNIQSGNGGYSVSSTNNSAVTASIIGTTVNIKGVGVGSSTITVKDAAGKTSNINIAVNAKDLKVSTTNISIDNGSSANFNITDGNGGYSASSSNTNIATVQGNNSSWTVTGKSAGTATITVKDSAGKTINITVIVKSTVKDLIIEGFGQSKVILLGDTLSFNIKSGNGGYTVSSSNTNAVTASILLNSVNIKSVGVGTSTVTVKDSSGKTVSIIIGVNGKDLIIDGFNQSKLILLGDTLSFNIKSGNGGYNVSSSNFNAVSVSILGTIVNIKGVGVGSSTVTVKDAAGKTISINIAVNAKDLKVSTTNISVDNGSSANFNITDGNGGYTVTSNNNNIASIGGSNTSWTVTGKSAGTTTATVKDSAGKTATINITVKSTIKDLIIDGFNQSRVISVLDVLSFNIQGGNGGYTVSSTNNSAVSASILGTIVNIKGVGVGSSTVTVKDAAGKTISINIAVNARDLKVSTNTISIQNGSSTSFSITTGNGGYTVISNNTSIATVQGSDTNWTVTGKSPGTTTLTVKDSQGKSLNISVNVSAKNLVVNKTSIEVNIGDTATFSVTDGNGGYSATSSNTNIATIQGSNTSWTVTGKSEGNTSITIKDSAGKSATISVTVKSPVKDLVIDGFNQSKTVKQGEILTFTIKSGNGGYTISSTDSSVATGSINGQIITIRAIGGGVANITVKDSKGKSLSLILTVTSIFTGVTYEQVGTGLRQVRFTVNSPNYQEVGYDMGNGVYKKVNKESDDYYLINVYKESCSVTCNFAGKLYIKDQGGNILNYNNNKTLSYNLNEAVISDGRDKKSQLNGVIDFGGWIISSVSGAVKKIDITRHLRNWSNLSQKDKDDFNDGIMDTLTTNDLYESALKLISGPSIEEIIITISKQLAIKYGITVAIKLGTKFIPYFGRALLGYSMYEVGSELANYMTSCTMELNQSIDGKGPLYYCGIIFVNGVMKAAGVGTSKKFEKFSFKNSLVKDFTSKKWTPNFKKHLLQGEINDKGDASGAHSIIAIKSNTARYEGSKKDLGNGFYSSKVSVFSQDLYNKQKSEYDKWLSDPRNKGKEYTYIKIEDFGRKKKSDDSTFFPDSWNEDKIKEEIAWAWNNVKPETIKIGDKTLQGYVGKTKDGFPIQFYTEDGTLNGAIKSAFANFNFK